MASKRTINRAYWVAVKATADGDGDTAREVFHRALTGSSDTVILPDVADLEAHYGPARLADVSRPELWPARTVVDAIRAGYPTGWGKMPDLIARRIASEWHGGQGTALYAFSSSGAIDTAREDHDIAAELTDCARSCRGKGGPDFTNLIDLRTYCRRHGPRGPVAGWSALSW